MRPAIAALIALALTACDSEGITTPDMGSGRCAAYCEQQQACGLTPRPTCIESCDDLSEACLTCGANSSCGNLEVGACADECGERDAGVGDDIGEPCAVNTQCSTGWCRAPDDMAEPVCARNDIGDPCQDATDCAAGACTLVAGAAEGTCAAPCESFADCPSFYTCPAGGGLCQRDE